MAVALTFNGDWLAVAESGSVAIWDTGKSEVFREFPWRGGYYTNALACSSEGHRLGIAHDTYVAVLDVTSGDERELIGDLGGVEAMAASPQGCYVATGGAEGVRVWDARNGRAIAAVRRRELTWHLHFGPRDEWLAMADSHSIEIVSLPQAEKLKEFIFPPESRSAIRDIGRSRDGTRMVVRNDSGNLTIVDLENDCVSTVVDAGWDAIDIMAISPNGKWLATGGRELVIRSIRDGSLMAAHGMNRRVKSLAWSPDSSSILVGGDGGVYSLIFKNQPD